MNKPNYTLRRIVAAAIVIVTFWATVKVAIQIAQPSYKCDSVSHTVQQGESLWSIAQTYCTGTIGDVVHGLTETYGATVHPGQVIVIK